jgi:hypothetical protein
MFRRLQRIGRQFQARYASQIYLIKNLHGYLVYKPRQTIPDPPSVYSSSTFKKRKSVNPWLVFDLAKLKSRRATKGYMSAAPSLQFPYLQKNSSSLMRKESLGNQKTFEEFSHESSTPRRSSTIRRTRNPCRLCFVCSQEKPRVERYVPRAKIMTNRAMSLVLLCGIYFIPVKLAKVLKNEVIKSNGRLNIGTLFKLCVWPLRFITQY